ncbi:MAG TPA: EAL domain-containing protein [Steroidobacteraceae bacterium]|nr:EAL domain-containing protein [Steroidobacteraceae bacterium]
MSNFNLNAAVRPPTEAPGETLETAESLGNQLLSLLPPLRLNSASIFNAAGDVQWLSEGALGPDEQVIVEEAITSLTATSTRAHLEMALADDTRAALFLAVRTPRATLAGVVMVLMDAKILNSGNLAARLLTTSMRSILQKIALLLAPPQLGATATFAGIRPFSSGTVPLEVAVIPGASVGDTANVSFSKDPKDALEWTPAAPLAATTDDAKVLEILEPAAADPPLATSDVLAWTAPETTPAADTTGTSEITFSCDPAPALPKLDAVQPLRLRELVRLRAGARTRRYQVVPVVEAQRGDTVATLTQLVDWLTRNPKAVHGDPLSFTIGVSAEALENAELPAALGRALATSPLDPGMIGFEVREATCLSHRRQVETLLAQCEQSRCFAVIDDFTFNTGVLELLRSNAVRMVKVESRLAATAMRDKLAQARIVAIAQAAKVLGTHCAAKYVDSQSGRRWLAAVGFDFSQTAASESLQRLLEPASA